jgi:hypothetical protein
MNRIKHLDFSGYHGLDHWPFTKSCRGMPKGGGFYHLKLAWDFRRRDQIFRWFYLLRCRWLDRHVDVLYSVGHNPGKECHYCKRHGTLTPADIEEMKKNWPMILRFPGSEDEVVALDPPPQ